MNRVDRVQPYLCLVIAICGIHAAVLNVCSLGRPEIFRLSHLTMQGDLQVTFGLSCGSQIFTQGQWDGDVTALKATNVFQILLVIRDI